MKRYQLFEQPNHEEVKRWRMLLLRIGAETKFSSDPRAGSDFPEYAALLDGGDRLVSMLIWMMKLGQESWLTISLLADLVDFQPLRGADIEDGFVKLSIPLLTQQYLDWWEEDVES